MLYKNHHILVPSSHRIWPGPGRRVRRERRSSSQYTYGEWADALHQHVRVDNATCLLSAFQKLLSKVQFPQHRRDSHGVRTKASGRGPTPMGYPCPRTSCHFN
ncbi:Piso0_005854 [Millerozyma farinosa CBS 7064]|uniref:Piso0_005854 protein n=1 Tax=Pichia sorbitophila (strain ATCC MYA-4447 / BCRC 22081 / CBS 7064 / NBRC 10061 / NRRL Y-12695) TaxID=559304 RepID=G8Y337_PICSO|nr:Piso0_005854 [Millerozyma farinosa CBS 7064]